LLRAAALVYTALATTSVGPSRWTTPTPLHVATSLGVARRHALPSAPSGRHRRLVLRHRARFLVMQKGICFFCGGGLYIYYASGAFTTVLSLQAKQRSARPPKATGLPLAGPDQARSLRLSPSRSTACRRDPRRRRTQHSVLHSHRAPRTASW
jgi:hypothetical protein